MRCVKTYTINKKTNDIELRKLAKDVFDMIESYKEPDLSKGIIIVNDKEKYQTSVEKSFSEETVLKETKEEEISERLRLFYVALTRAKTDIYILTERSNISDYILKIQNYIKK